MVTKDDKLLDDLDDLLRQEREREKLANVMAPAETVIVMYIHTYL